MIPCNVNNVKSITILLEVSQDVFIVKPTSDSQRSLVWLLESVGMKIHCFFDGDCFLKACDRKPLTGCVLLDSALPDMEGFTLVPITARLARLTRQEREVVEYIIEGYRSKCITKEMKAIKLAKHAKTC